MMQNLEKSSIEKILNSFKNNKDIIAIYLSENNIMGNQIESDIIKKTISMVEKAKNLLSANYLTFNIDKYTVIAFKYQDSMVTIFGNPNIKEPVIKIAIKSLQ